MGSMVEHIAYSGGRLLGGGSKVLDYYVVCILIFVIMVDVIDSLSNLSEEDIEEALKQISSNSEDMIPIEIDGVVYDIPLPVQYLIDNLALQIKEMSSYDGVVMPN